MIAGRALFAILFSSLLSVCAPLPATPQETVDGQTGAAPAINASEDRPLGLRIIIVSTRREAVEILGEVAGGRPFALLARERSIDEVTRDTFGYLGKLKKEDLGEPLKAAVEELLSAPDRPEGRAGGPVALPDGNFALFQVVDLGPFTEGEKAFRSGDFKAAEKALREHVAANPDASASRLMLGKIFETDGRLFEAEKMYNEAVEYHPDLEQAYAALGRLLMKMARFEEARDVFLKGMKHGESPLLKEGLEMVNILLLQREERMP